MIKREKYIKKIENILSLNKSIFLVWARQVWKTSLMRYVKENTSKKVFYINFDEVVTKWYLEFNNLLEFIQYINAYFWINLEDYEILLFDEVVRIKNFNIILKWLVDKFEKINFISSASGNYEIIDNIIEWLAWRVVKIEVFPLDFKEYLLFKWKNIDLGNMTENLYSLLEKDLFEYLTFWSYPEVVLESNYKNKKIILKSIVDSVFSKDLRGFIKENKFIDLDKFTNYLSKNIWSLFSYEWLANDLWIKLNDVKNFIYYLEKSYLIFKLHPFFSDKSLEYSRKQKLYFNNFWISNYMNGNLELKKSIDWKDVEHTIFLNLKYNLDLNNKLYFYQKINWSKIDFILKESWKIYPIEAKLSNKDIIPKIFSSFSEKYFDEIWYFIRSTNNKTFERILNDKKVIMKPFFSILWVEKLWK